MCVKYNLPEKCVIFNTLQRFKTIRHPGIIKFRDAIFTDTYLYLITEPVIPLSRVWRELPPEETALGIHALLMSSLYVSIRERTWLLGGLELAAPFHSKSLAGTILLGRTTAPEDHNPSAVIQDNDYSPGARDIYALGHLLSILLAPHVAPTATTADLHRIFDWRALQVLADAMCAMNPANRGSLVSVLAHPVFSQNSFLYYAGKFLPCMRAMEAAEKIAGFGKIGQLFRKLPESTVVAYIIPKLLNTDLFGEPGIELILSDVFSPNGLLSSSIYVNFIIPFISQHVKSREFVIRKTMLRLFPLYFAALFDYNPTGFLLSILPELLMGINEANQEIYALTLSAICFSIPRQHQYESSPVCSHASARLLVDNIVIPRILNCCIDDAITKETKEFLLKSFTDMWKKVTVVENKHTVSDLRGLAANILMESLPIVTQYPPVKIDLACEIPKQKIVRNGRLIVHHGPRQLWASNSASQKTAPNECETKKAISKTSLRSSSREPCGIDLSNYTFASSGSRKSSDTLHKVSRNAESIKKLNQSCSRDFYEIALDSDNDEMARKPFQHTAIENVWSTAANQ
ncbi:hypothetical protein HDU82_008706 [Entophlyctis luteolus]|nr:hypothetical protein HDU82_008706 [Entophlyctis luteolus]